MSDKSDVDRIISRLSDYGTDEGMARGFVNHFAGLWAMYGSKKYTGRKGKKLIDDGLQELYVMLGSSKDKVEELEMALKRRINLDNAEHDPIVIRAKDSIRAERSRMESIEEKFRFLSMLKSIEETLERNDSKLLLEIDKMLEDRKTIDFYKDSTKEHLNDHQSNMMRMDELQTYMETLMDHKKDNAQLQESHISIKERDETEDRKNRKAGVL